MLKKLLTILLITLFMQSVAFAETVVFKFNVDTKKIHSINCTSAKKCTKNCIKIDRKKAVKRGGVPCKNCAG